MKCLRYLILHVTKKYITIAFWLNSFLNVYAYLVYLLKNGVELRTRMVYVFVQVLGYSTFISCTVRGELAMHNFLVQQWIGYFLLVFLSKLSVKLLSRAIESLESAFSVLWFLVCCLRTFQRKSVYPIWSARHPALLLLPISKVLVKIKLPFFVITFCIGFAVMFLILACSVKLCPNKLFGFLILSEMHIHSVFVSGTSILAFPSCCANSTSIMVLWHFSIETVLNIT